MKSLGEQLVFQLVSFEEDEDLNWEVSKDSSL